MTLKDEYAAMAARLIDDELAWRLRQLPRDEKPTPMQEALLKEAERRGFKVSVDQNSN